MRFHLKLLFEIAVMRARLLEPLVFICKDLDIAEAEDACDLGLGGVKDVVL